METWVAFGGVKRAGASRVLPTLVGIGLLALGAGATKWYPTPPQLEELDPVLMRAVTSSVSQHDVKAILAHRPSSSGPVHIKLYTSCDEVQHCTVFTAMDFTDALSEQSTVSLRVAVSVLAGSSASYKICESSWQVRRTDPATDASATYAGLFSNLGHFPPIGDSKAITALLVSIQSAIEDALLENGVSPNHGN
ncbi:hypothetical protein ACFPOU_09640 [Massilia jejuensis]|uniref:Uncharacterized protein n=1 Tax=Massilia jejuensis TaxID=648894 RepID=A0ABW0PGF4_9BURK